jgi:uncharacterized membrane protein YfcA
LAKAFREFPPRSVTTHIAPLGFTGALLDTIGGGGWGPVVASTLVARGNHVRTTVGTVNAVEFFVTFAASVTFFLTIGLTNWHMILALALSAACPPPPSAPGSAGTIPVKRLMVIVGLLVIADQPANPAAGLRSALGSRLGR